MIALKGVYLVEAVYANIGLRTFSDLDFLVRKNELSTVLSLMQELGYRVSTYYDPQDANLDTKHIPPMEKEGGPIVEMHWGILEENEPFEINMDGIWQGAIPARVAGVDVLALDNEDLLLHLCIHFTYQHRLRAGLKYLVDIAEVLHKFKEEVDWQKLVSTAAAWGAQRVVWLTFSLLDEILGTTVPREVLDQLIPQAVDPGILQQAIFQVLPAGKGMQGSLTPDLVTLAGTHGIFARFRLIWSRIFLPRRVIARLYNISPDSFKIYGYYFVRFSELYRVYCRSIWRLFKREEHAIGRPG